METTQIGNNLIAHYVGILAARKIIWKFLVNTVSQRMMKAARENQRVLNVIASHVFRYVSQKAMLV